MTQQKRLCGVSLSSVGVLTVLFYLIDRSLASLDGYIPGQDYPVYTEVPKGLSFTCDDKIPGYYADPETMCQVWHWCVPSIGGNLMYSFVCGAGTVFNQRTRVCDWFFKVDCPNAPAYYGINEDLYKDEAGNFINGKKGNSYNNLYDRRRFSARRKRHEYAMRQSGKTDSPDFQDRSDKLELTDTTSSGKTDGQDIQSRSDRVEVGSRRKRARKFKSHKKQASETHDVTKSS